MTDTLGLRCDGCGQAATPEHVARRLRRLEWTTRYRPVHISNLFLGAFSPQEDREFLYSTNGEFGGEAGELLKAVGIATVGKGADAILAEFQRAGFFLTHVLECPLEEEGNGARDDKNEFGRRDELAAGTIYRAPTTDAGREATRAAGLLRERLASVASRIRRSLKPKRVILVTDDLLPVVENIVMLDLGCPVVVNDGKPFAFSALASVRDSW